MKLTLFSHDLSEVHIEKLSSFFNKPLKEVKFLFINTPAVYKPYKPDWLIRCENLWRSVFPLFQEFDIKHAFETEPGFDFENFYNEYDYIYVSGGNLYILSYWMQKTCSDVFISDLIKSGKVVYGGESAGAIYAFRDLEPYQLLGNPEKASVIVNQGMDILPFAPLPHWGNSEYDEGLSEIYHLLNLKKYEAVRISDSQGCFVEDDRVTVI